LAIVFDTSVLVEADRRSLPLRVVVELATDGESLAVAAITIAELLVGVHMGQPPSRQRERSAFVERVAQHFQIFSFDKDVAAIYAEIWAGMRLSGSMIPPHDLMIASMALTNGFDVLTQNVSHFRRIPRLTVRTPAW
jgi:tRNA(fMet)-specific endonuclease VapC